MKPVLEVNGMRQENLPVVSVRSREEVQWMQHYQQSQKRIFELTREINTLMQQKEKLGVEYQFELASLKKDNTMLRHKVDKLICENADMKKALAVYETAKGVDKLPNIRRSGSLEVIDRYRFPNKKGRDSDCKN